MRREPIDRETTLSFIHAAVCLAAVAVVPVCLAEQRAIRHDPSHAHRYDVGDLTVIVGDHYPHGGCERPSYTGIHHLSHRLRQSNVFCPRYAGMIGLRRACRITRAGQHGATLSVGEGPSLRSETFVVAEPHYVDYEGRFTAGSATGRWNNTSYMNGPADPAIYVVNADGEWTRHYSAKHGHRASVAPAGMDPLPPVTKVEHPKYPHGSDKFWEGFSDLRLDPKYPLFYGRFDEMVLIFMTERKWGSAFIPYTSPSGGGYSREWSRTNPAWDFRYWIKGLQPGQEAAIRSRVCYKPFVSQADVLREYEDWMGALGGPSR